MDLLVCICVQIYLCSQAMHTLLAGQRGTDEQTLSIGGPVLRLFLFFGGGVFVCNARESEG